VIWLYGHNFGNSGQRLTNVDIHMFSNSSTSTLVASLFLVLYCMSR